MNETIDLEQTFRFLDAVIAGDMKKALRIALEIEQGEQIQMSFLCDNGAHVTKCH